MRFSRSSVAQKRWRANQLWQTSCNFWGVKTPRFKLRTRIFTSMLLVVVVSFVMTGVISSIHFHSSRTKYHRERLLRKEQAIEAHMSRSLQMLTAVPLAPGSHNLVYAQEDLMAVSQIHNMDLGLYTNGGELIALTDSSLAAREVLPQVLPDSLRLSHDGATHKEVRYNGATKEYMLYTAELLSEDGTALALLVLPYDMDALRAPDQEAEFFQALAWFNIILFLAAAYLAYLLSRSISRGLEIVSEALRVNPGTGPRPRIKWRSKDEIGTLINHYNMMVDQVEANAKKLAEAEKESAWKAMAQQVAHEVKNPLTPMRLMTQMHAAQAGSMTSGEIKAFADGMIAQIDAMADVANDFGQIARGPAEVRPMEISPILLEIEATYPQVKVLKQPAISSVSVRANHEQLTRVLNNLINNAMEAIPTHREPNIVLSATLEEQEIWLSVRDNGGGIPMDTRKEIFQPKFTTKTHGTGLGLAIVKALVEGFGGRIWVEKSDDEGTEFCVALPI